MITFGPIVIGCDPGSEGYLCAINQDNNAVDWLKMPFIETGKRISEVDIAAVVRWLDNQPVTPKYFVIEDVGHMPAGKSGFGGSGFSDSILSRRVGELVGMLKAYNQINGRLQAGTIPYELVPARTWHGLLDIKITKVKDEKHAARKKRIKAAVVAWCGRRYPHVSLIPGKCKVPQDGMADALALAHVAATKCLGSGVAL